jgi:hypothetical protein
MTRTMVLVEYHSTPYNGEFKMNYSIYNENEINPNYKYSSLKDKQDDLNSFTILVVDDNSDKVRLIGRTL